MKDAQTLFREGVMALRERKDVAQGRRLLTESLRLDPQNEMAWLWLAQTMSAPDKRLQCIDRALRINPDNAQALALKQRYAAALPPNDHAPPPVTPKAPARKTDQQATIRRLLDKADELIEEGDPEAAIECWVQVLEIEVDHEVAMRNAVGYLSRLKYLDDAKELVWRAIDAGTTHPSIYLTAIDIARYNRDFAEEESLGEMLATMPEIDDGAIFAVAERLIKTEQLFRAEEMLKKAIETHPKSQKLLKLLGDIYDMMGQPVESARYYDRAARLGTGTKEGREADKRLNEQTAVLTDRERGSVALAWREALGFGVVFLLMAWQDAGLNLLALGAGRWMGVGVAVVGGYLAVTATSSPQQQPLGGLLGGEIPYIPQRKIINYDKNTTQGLVEEPTSLPIIPLHFRLVFGVIGLLLLGLALWLTFNTAINLLLDPVTPPDLPSIYDFLE